MTRQLPRAGFTLLEVMLVMAILIIFAAVAAPTIFSVTRDTEIKAAADTIKARANDARAAAVGENRTYRLGLSGDGTQIRVAPDDAAFDTMGLNGDSTVEGPTVIVDRFGKDVTATVIPDPEFPTITDDAGWIRVATFKSDGTARRDAAIQVNQPSVAPLRVNIRALTGATTIVSRTKGEQ